MSSRLCSRTGCNDAAGAALTFVYADQTAVLGPIGQTREPNSYALCRRHADRLTVPRGWEVLRLPFGPASEPDDDLLALVDSTTNRRTTRDAATQPQDEAKNNVRSIPANRPDGSKNHPAGKARPTRAHLYVVK